ncbi:MAG: hypothetical protein NT076_03640 [Candidatus Pacearchaeota archaeon]|nr:hypothetical protein [Candidatus Pacearchaeota archaeon]
MLCNLLKKQVLFLFVILIFVFNLSLVFALDYSTGGSVYGVLADIGNTNRTGALNLTLQMGTCSLANCTDIVWSAVYTNATYTSLASLGNATYFQCKATFFTENQNYSNYLFNFTIGYTTLISSGVPPNITILSPLNQSYTTNSIDFNISSSANLSLCLVSLNNWATNYTMNINSTLTGANLTNSSMPQGSSTANFWCNDTSNNINGTSQVTFYVDSINPSINITYPLNTTYSVKPTALNYTASDTNLQSCWYSLDSGATNTSVACGTNVTGLSANEGSNTWQVWANDTLNNVNSSSVTFYVDTVPPYFTTIPANQSITYGTWLGVQFVGNDALSFGTYYLGNWTTAFSINSSGWLSNKTKLPVGYYQINVTINDSSGNTNMTWFGVNLTAVPDTTPPYFTTIPATTVINYTQGFGVDFNATDETAFGYYYINWTTLFTINQSGWLTNSTPNVAVGNYYINVTINDTLNNQNSTIYLVNISKYITILTLNPTTPITYGTPTNFVANEGGCPSQLICSLNISDGVYSAGTISANYSTSGNENYTSSSVVSTVTINQASSSVGLTATTPITYGTITDFTGNSCPDASCTLNISNAIYPSGTISANYSFVGNQNYTASSSVFTVTINKANSQTSLVFDKTSPQEYPTAITPTCSIITGGTETLTLTNGTSGVAETLGVNSWNLNCSYAGNTNYTASSNFSQFTISQNTTYTLGLTATTPITYGTPTDVAGSG